MEGKQSSENAGIWQRLFIKSFGTDFDYNGRWAKFQKHIGTNGAKKQSKKPLSKGKRKLPCSRDVKGGIVAMKKNKVLHKKQNQRNLNGYVFSTRILRIVTHYTNIFNGRLNATLLFAGYVSTKNIKT